MSRNERVVVILNPASGSSDDGYRAGIEESLRARGAEFEIRETTPERDGRVLAREAQAEGAALVLACGGDGTVTAAINGLGAAEPGGQRAALGIVPGGTANLVAAALGIPTEVEAAVAAALEGKEREIDLGRRTRCSRWGSAWG